jgi:hypothetical protein
MTDMQTHNDPFAPPAPVLEPLPHEPHKPFGPDDAIDQRAAQLDQREALITARENRMADILKKNALEAHPLDDAFIDSQIVDQYSVTGTDAFDGHPNITPQAARALACMTLCVYVLRNGFVVTGEGFSDSPEAYDHNKGMTSAREDAKRKIWMLERYAQRNKLQGL